MAVTALPTAYLPAKATHNEQHTITMTADADSHIIQTSAFGELGAQVRTLSSDEVEFYDTAHRDPFDAGAQWDKIFLDDGVTPPFQTTGVKKNIGIVSATGIKIVRSGVADGDINVDIFLTI